MLRARPEHCPLCGHDVRAQLRCAGCGEALPLVEEARPRAERVRAVASNVGALLGGTAAGLGIAAVAAIAVVQPLVAVGLAVGAPIAAGVATGASRRAAAWARSQWRRAQRRRGRGPAPSGESLVHARQVLVSSPEADVTVSGRVRLEIPIVEDSDEAVRARRAGRFVLETSAGEALVDDDGILAGPELVVSDGDLVEVTGPARLVHDPSVSPTDYRGMAAMRLVFDATPARPLSIRRL